jgi:L-fucose isomerase-like protein
MQENLKRTLPLAKRVLGMQDVSVDETVLALQLISRFGDESDVEEVRSALEDDRTVALESVGEKQLRVEVRDLAAVTIMILKRKPLDEIGLDPNALHPKIGFIPRGFGFPTDDPEPRSEMLKALNALLEPAENTQAEPAEDNNPG